MKLVNLCFLLLMSVACSTNSANKPVSWSEKKRECHTHYLDRFGLKAAGVIGICREELGRSD